MSSPDGAYLGGYSEMFVESMSSDLELIEKSPAESKIQPFEGQSA